MSICNSIEEDRSHVKDYDCSIENKVDVIQIPKYNSLLHLCLQ